MSYQINREKLTVRVWNAEVSEKGQWYIEGIQKVWVAYHPYYDACLSVLTACRKIKKCEAPSEFRILIQEIEAPYKQDVYQEAILYGLVDWFRLLLKNAPQFQPTAYLQDSD